MTKKTCEASEELSLLFHDVSRLNQAVSAGAERRLARYASYYPTGQFSVSARNLAHYLALRAFDLRLLQARLSAWGLSSLGRGESHVQTNLNCVLELLSGLCDGNKTVAGPQRHVNDIIEDGSQILARNTEALFGVESSERAVRIMVTLPTEASWDFDLVKALVENGMNCARINCAHDDCAAWERMIVNVRRATRDSGRSCKILMDLAGHKIRTGPVKMGPAVLHIKPKKDVFGRVTAPAIVFIDSDIISTADGQNKNCYRLAIPGEFHERLSAGQRLAFVDSRGKHRHLRIVDRDPNGCWISHCDKSAYLTAQTEFDWQHEDGNDDGRSLGCFPVCPFPGRPLEIRVFQGDPLILSKEASAGQPPLCDEQGQILSPARIGSTMPQIIDRLRPGASVWIDDGKLGAVVESICDEGVMLRVTEAGPKGVRIAAEKGLNFPDTDLNLAPLSAKDEQDLDFVCQHADMVGFSFVETLDDVNDLLAELKKRGAADLPVILKIETDRAVSNLPDLLLGTIGRQTMGIMIARGDLSVELGSVRLAEIQEEILWLCEAAHVPVVWATQVLETLAKKGARSRPEFTDAAMGVRAECVMLNKGPHILQAVRALSDVLIRMQAHQHKKTPQLRALHLAKE